MGMAAEYSCLKNRYSEAQSTDVTPQERCFIPYNCGKWVSAYLCNQH